MNRLKDQQIIETDKTIEMHLNMHRREFEELKLINHAIDPKILKFELQTLPIVGYNEL